MPQPPAYNRTKDFTENFGTETDHANLNAELDKVSNSINDVRTNLAILQADDGKLRPEVVTPESVAPALFSLIVDEVKSDAVQLLADANTASANAIAQAETATAAAASATASKNAAAAAEANAATYAAQAQAAIGQPADGSVTDAKLSASNAVLDAIVAKLRFVGAGVGAAYRSLRDKLRDQVSVKDYGAVGDGDADDTAAVQAAIAYAAANGKTVFFPAGTYKISDAITVDTGVYGRGIILRGEGRNSLIHQTGAGKDAIRFSSTQVLQNSGLRDLSITCAANAGHCINIVYGCTTCFFENLELTQLNPAKACIYGDYSAGGAGVYDTEFKGGNYYLPGGNTATQAGVRFIAAGTVVNENKFQNLRCYYSGSIQFFHFTVVGGGSWLTNNSFENINFEVCNGGGFLFSCVKNHSLKNISFWDANGPYTNHLVVFAAGAGPESVANTLQNVGRNGDALAASVRDIRIESGQDTVIINCYTQPADSPSYDFNGKRVAVIGRLYNVLNGTAAITLLPESLSGTEVFADNVYGDVLHVGGRSTTESAKVFHSGGYTSIENVAATTGVILAGKDGSGNFKKLVWTATELFPLSDNVHTLGIPSNRWTTIYASTATINTSDERAKQQVQPIDEAALRAWGKVQYCQYKFNDAVQAKGDGARWHFGVIAQRVKEAFESEGLDPFAYGILCFDKWEARDAVVDEAGNEILPAATAGEMYGVRYEEALALECAYLRSRMQ